MTLSLAICFYRDVGILIRTLDSVAAQTRLPDEIIIADDGSEASLETPISNWANDRRLPVIHVWHPKDGFRQSEMRNKAAFVATSEFIVFTDHDCLLPRGFVRRHLAFADENRLHLGPRINVMPPATATFRPGPFPILGAFVTKRLYGWKTACRRNAIRQTPPTVIAGCNLLVPKKIINTTNGFDEDFRSWGYEDAEFVVRAWHAGFGMGLSGYGTTVFHLHHPSRANSDNQPRFEASVAERRTRCENGISKHTAAATTRTNQGYYTRVAFPY